MLFCSHAADTSANVRRSGPFTAEAVEAHEDDVPELLPELHAKLSRRPASLGAAMAPLLSPLALIFWSMCCTSSMLRNGKELSGRSLLAVRSTTVGLLAMFKSSAIDIFTVGGS